VPFTAAFEAKASDGSGRFALHRNAGFGSIWQAMVLYFEKCKRSHC
jgi:hypothetical protein